MQNQELNVGGVKVEIKASNSPTDDEVELKRLLTNTSLSRALWLVYNQLPIRIAFECSDEEFSEWIAADKVRLKWLVIKLNEFRSGEFDFNTLISADRE
ncbi:hypothetical protein ACO0K2_17760 [Undibacterium sp. MH2W]|uniref:hypothetical protein n=1 Tax=Undibacterium sp. MH2W TaxID=3413044 RepID=UPI003BF25BF2